MGHVNKAKKAMINEKNNEESEEINANPAPGPM